MQGLHCCRLLDQLCILYRACLHSLLFMDAGAALLRIVGSGMYPVQSMSAWPADYGCRGCTVAVCWIRYGFMQ